MVRLNSLGLILSLFILGACASKMKDQMKDYRDTYAMGDMDKADQQLEASELKKEERSKLLWHMEKGTVEFGRNDFDKAISNFQSALDLIDKLYTSQLSKKAASFLINDAADVFYGANYERSYAHYYLAKSYYARYQKTHNKLDLQGARGTILAWDTYFTDLQRSSASKSLYQTDLMLKAFGGEIHEVSGIANDKQIALQLYKDALKILDQLGGIYALFNKKNDDYIKAYVVSIKEGKAPNPNLYEQTPAYSDLKDFLQYKVLALTKEIRGYEYKNAVNNYKPSALVLKRMEQPKANVTLVLEEGLIPPKMGKPFNFGIRGAVNAVESPAAKAFIATVGTAVLTGFAMNTLGMAPTQTASPGSFYFAHDVTRLAVQEAAIEFELPMIENVPLVQRLEVFVLDDKGVVVNHAPLPVVTENGDLARVILEEDVVSRYVKTGTRVAVRHLIAIVAAMGVYQKLSRGSGGDFLAKTAAMATYVGASKGIAALERADTRHWTTLPQAMRMSEFHLKPGSYQIALGAYAGTKTPDAPAKIIGNIQVTDSGKSIHTLKFNKLP